MNKKLRILSGILVAAGLALGLAGCGKTVDGGRETSTATADRRPTTAAPTRTGTAVPSATATVQPSPTASPSPVSTLTQTVTPAPTETQILPFYSQPQPAFATPTPIFTPESGALSYRLKTWTEEQAFDLIWLLDQYAHDNDIREIGDNRFAFQIAQQPIHLALLEFLYRFPHSTNNELAKWRLTYTNAIIGNSESDAWLLETLQTGLNDERFTPSDMKNVLGKYGFTIFNGFHSEDFIQAPNLFGDGRDVQVFRITTQESWGGDGLFVAMTEDNTGHYTLTPIYSDWHFSVGSDSIPFIGDNNHNGIPEIVLYIGIHISFDCLGNLLIYEWRGDHFIDLTRQQIGFDDCGSEWKYDTLDENGIPTILVENRPFEPDARFKWTGQFYELLETIRPKPEVLTTDSESLDWLANALEQGQYQLISEQIEQSLSQPLQNYGDSGPSAPDYLRFQLGMSYALQAKIPEARDVLRSLVVSPVNPSVTALSTAAQAFLDNYTSDQDVYTACLGALDVMEQVIAPYRDDNGFVDWDVYPHYWGYTPGYQPDVPICSLEAALKFMVSNWEGPHNLNIPVVLHDSGVTLFYSSETDVDGDGNEDWIIATSTPWKNEAGLWIMLTTDSGFTPIRIAPSNDNSHRMSAQAQIKSEVINLPGSDRPVVFLQIGEKLYAFQLVIGQIRPYLQWIVNLSHVDGYSIHENNNPPELQVTFTADEYTPNWRRYQWNGENNDFDLVDEQPSTAQLQNEGPHFAAQQAEAKLLEDWNLTEAIPMLKTVLSYHQTSGETPNWYESNTRPRLFYLLALAYELTGDETNAVQTYWQLWRDHPDSPYALMARAKLELRNP